MTYSKGGLLLKMMADDNDLFLENVFDIRLNLIGKPFTNKILNYLKNTHGLDETEISIPIFGSQYPTSDFDLTVLIEDDTFNKKLGKIKEEIIKISKEPLVLEDILDTAIQTLKEKELPDDIKSALLEFLNGFKPEFKFWYGPLDTVKKQEEIPGISSENPMDYVEGFDNIGSDVRATMVSETGVTLAGFDIIPLFKNKIGNLVVHPSQGYDLYNIAHVYNASAVFENNPHYLIKTLSELTNAISVISGQGVLVTLDEKITKGKRLLSMSTETKEYEKIYEQALLAKKRGVKAEQEFLKNLDVDIYYCLFEHLDRLFKIRAFETGYVYDKTRKNNLEGYIERTTAGLFENTLSKANCVSCGQQIKIDANVCPNCVTAIGDEVVLNINNPRFLQFYVDNFLKYREKKIRSGEDVRGIDRILRESEKVLGSQSSQMILKGKIKIALGEFAEAEKIFKNVMGGMNVMLSKNPDYVLYSYTDLDRNVILSDLYKNYGISLMNLDEKDKAQSFLEKAIALDPLNPSLWHQLSDIFIDDVIKSNKCANIGKELENDTYDVFKIQNLGGEDVQKLFDYWRNNLKDTFNMQLKRFVDMIYSRSAVNGNVKEQGLLNQIIERYNRSAESKDSYVFSLDVCFGFIQKLERLSKFVRDDLLKIIENIDDDTRIDMNIPTTKGQVESVCIGLFPIYQQLRETYFMKKRSLEEELQKIDEALSKMNKIYPDKLSNLSDMAPGAEKIKEYLRFGCIDSAVSCLETYKGTTYLDNNTAQKIQEEIEEQKGDGCIARKEIRYELKKQLNNSFDIFYNTDKIPEIACSCGKHVLLNWNFCLNCKNTLDKLRVIELNVSKSKYLKYEGKPIKNIVLDEELDSPYFELEETIDKDISDSCVSAYVFFNKNTGDQISVRACLYKNKNSNRLYLEKIPPSDCLQDGEFNIEKIIYWGGET